jgi:hypothetical protein
MKKWLTRLQQSLGILTKHEKDQVGLFIPNRQVSWLLSSILIFGFLCFILGYFWGHRRALQRFVAKIEEESFADRISYALYTMNDRDSSEFEQEQEDTNETNGPEDTNGSDEQEELVEIEESTTAEKQTPDAGTSTTATSLTKKEVLKTPLTEEKKQAEKMTALTTPQHESTTVFVAPLAGFGTLSAATEFIERVKILDPQATVQKRTSKTQKGRTVIWYQAVTGEYEKKDELQKITTLIQKKEHLKKVEITEKRKG